MTNETQQEQISTGQNTWQSRNMGFSNLTEEQLDLLDDELVLFEKKLKKLGIDVDCVEHDSGEF